MATKSKNQPKTKARRQDHIMRPRLQTLQAFSNGYFRQKPPKIKWVKSEEFAGYTDDKKNIIELNPLIDLERNFCTIGGLFSIEYEEQFKLQVGEQYFLTLLHEIAHFKITFSSRVKVPSGYKALKKKLRKMSKKHTFVHGEFEFIVESELEKHYKDEYLIGAIEDFYAYYRSRDFSAHHMAVEDWARAEFKKRRKDIQTILQGGICA
jgi:hypothetical protein